MMMAVVVVSSSAARTNCDYIDYIDNDDDGDDVINHDVALHPILSKFGILVLILALNYGF